jgi:membrane protein required for colicin V production
VLPTTGISFYSFDIFGEMNYLDLIIGVVIVAGIIRGFIKGFIYEIAVLSCLFLGYYLGFKFADTVSVYLKSVFKTSGTTLHYLSFFTIWLAVSVGIFFLAKLFEGLISITALGVFNKIAGAVFSGVKFILICGVLILFFNRMDSKYNWLDPDKKAASKFYYPVLNFAKNLLPVLEKF